MLAGFVGTDLLRIFAVSLSHAILILNGALILTEQIECAGLIDDLALKSTVTLLHLEYR